MSALVLDAWHPLYLIGRVCGQVVFSSLMVKTWRIHRIFNSHELQNKQLDWRTLMKIVGVCVCLDGIMLAIWMGSDTPSAHHIPFPTKAGTCAVF
jgi:hypothetical protein